MGGKSKSNKPGKGKNKGNNGKRGKAQQKTPAKTAKAKGKGSKGPGKHGSKGPGKSKTKTKNKSKGKDSRGPPAVTAKRPRTSRDNHEGKKLCQAYNDGGCTEQCKKNPQEEHRCNGLLSNGNACNGWHRSKDCERCLWR